MTCINRINRDGVVESRVSPEVADANTFHPAVVDEINLSNMPFSGCRIRYDILAG
ncbi:MAG: hypothetical protein IPJ12_16450 [Betaproteobacteria bacterium]|nr:hypothetical protein [Betaproteobacteria bacterium]